MRSGWRRTAVFCVAVVGLVAFVALATRNEEQTTALLVTEIGFIAVVSYLFTYLLWPRQPHLGQAHPSRRPRPEAVRPEPAMVDRDPRPVLVIGERPAGSKPGSEVHLRDSPTMRAPRGRRPGPRARAEIRWPAQR